MSVNKVHDTVSRAMKIVNKKDPFDDSEAELKDNYDEDTYVSPRNGTLTSDFETAPKPKIKATLPTVPRSNVGKTLRDHDIQPLSVRSNENVDNIEVGDASLVGSVKGRNFVTRDMLDILEEDGGNDVVFDEEPAQIKVEGQHTPVSNQNGFSPTPPKITKQNLKMREEPKKTTIDSLIVKTKAGVQYPLKDIELFTTVLQLKELVAKQATDLAVASIRLIHKGKPLTDDKSTVEQIGINEGDDLFMVIRLDQNAQDATAAKNEGVEVKIEATKKEDRGLMRIRVPPKGPGNHVQITPPGGATFRVYIPATMKVGDVMTVKIPQENAEGQIQHEPGITPLSSSVRSRTRTESENNNRGIGSGVSGLFRSNKKRNKSKVARRSAQRKGNTAAPNVDNSKLMKVICPTNGKPGDTIEMRIPEVGKMRVKIPPNAVPGQPFYFRIKTNA